MSVEQANPAGRRAADLGFYFNADDTLRTGAPAQAPWEPRWIEDGARPLAFEPGAQPARAGRGRSVLVVVLALLLAAGAAMAVVWRSTPPRYSRPRRRRPWRPCPSQPRQWRPRLRQRRPPPRPSPWPLPRVRPP